MTETVFNEFRDHTPFIINLLGLLFKILGIGYAQARLFAGIFGIIATILVYLLVNKKFGNKTATLSSLLFLLSLPVLKQSRFPNQDVPLMLFNALSVYSFYYFYETRKKIYFISSGIFFGLAMLTKGPLAVFAPLSIFLFLVIKRDFKVLFSLIAIGSLVLGLLVFALWPLTLYWNGRIDIFWKYLDFTFVGTIKILEDRSKIIIGLTFSTSLPSARFRWFCCLKESGIDLKTIHPITLSTFHLSFFCPR